jgi:hypothetical protein
MSKVDPFRRRTWKAPLAVSRERAARADLVTDLVEYAEREREPDYCTSCDYCDPTLGYWREWQEGKPC